jgi:hypothetical protein
MAFNVGSIVAELKGDFDRRGFDQFDRATKNAARDVDRLEKSTGRLRGAMGGLAKAGAVAGVAGIGLALKGSVSAAIEAEKSQARLQAQLKASGISFKAHRDEIEQVIQKHSQLSGLDDEDLQDAFTNIVRVTGDVNKSLKLTGLAADFARAKHMDVAKAGELVGKVAGGNVGILSRYGIQIEKGASATEALGVLQQKFSGQAEAYGKTTAGAQNRLQVAVENLGEAIGSRLLPFLAKVADGMANFVREMENGEGTGGKVRRAFERVASAIGGVISRVRTVIRFFRDNENAATALQAVLTTLAIRWVALRVIATVTTLLAKARGAMILLNLAMRANPLGLVVTALALLAGALVTAWRRSQTFRTIVTGVFDAVKTTVGDVISWIMRRFDDWLGIISTTAGAFGWLPGVGGKFKDVARKIDEARESIRAAADKVDSLGEKSAA